jgi:hypothetical protein
MHSVMRPRVKNPWASGGELLLLLLLGCRRGEFFRGEAAGLVSAVAERAFVRLPTPAEGDVRRGDFVLVSRVIGERHRAGNE